MSPHLVRTYGVTGAVMMFVERGCQRRGRRRAVPASASSYLPVKKAEGAISPKNNTSVCGPPRKERNGGE